MKNPVWVVEEVQPQADYTLLLTFTSGEKRVYHARPLLEKPIYAQLKNLAFFLGAKAACGTVIWNDDIDIAPEHLYECSSPIAGIAHASSLCDEHEPSNRAAAQ